MMSVKEMMDRKNVVNESREMVVTVSEKVTRNSVGYPFTDKVFIDGLGKLTIEDCRYLRTQYHIVIDDENGYAYFDHAYAQKCQFEVDAAVVELDKLFETYQQKFVENIIKDFQFKADLSNRKADLNGARVYLFEHFENLGFRVDIDKNYIITVTIPEA
jgi:hypothetical protein